MSLPENDSGFPTPAGTPAPTPFNVPSEWSLDDAPPAGPRAPAVLPPDENTIRSARDLAAAREAAVGGRSAAMLIRQNLEEMTSSVREMEDFLKTAATRPVSAEAEEGGSRRGGRGRRGKNGRGDAAQKNPGAPAGRKGRKGRNAPQNGGAQPAPSALPPPAPAVPEGEPPAAAQESPAAPAPAQPDLPVIRIADLQSLAPDALLSLAREQEVLVGQDPRRRQSLVMGLLLKHVHRGGAVEGEGVFLPSGEGPDAPRGGFRGVAGHLRSFHNGLRPAPEDVAMPADLRDRLGLRPGDFVVCRTRFLAQGANGSFEAADVVSVNGMDPERSRQTPPLAALPLDSPSRPVALRTAAAPSRTLDLADALAPLAFGQRGLLVAPDERAASETLDLLAEAIAAANPAARTLLVRPAALPAPSDGGASAVTVLQSEFDDPPDRHARLVADAAETARRGAELGRDVVLLVDGLPRLLGESAAALGLSAPRRAEEGVLPALRRLLASARAVRGGGSVTVLVGAVDPSGRCAALDQLRAGALEVFGALADWFVRLAPAGAACPIEAASARSGAAARLRPDDDGSALRASLSDPASAPAALKAFFKRLPPPPAVEAVPAFQTPV